MDFTTNGLDAAAGQPPPNKLKETVLREHNSSLLTGPYPSWRNNFP
jgi:hypothetical protein